MLGMLFSRNIFQISIEIESKNLSFFRNVVRPLNVSNYHFQTMGNFERRTDDRHVTFLYQKKFVFSANRVLFFCVHLFESKDQFSFLYPLKKVSVSRGNEKKYAKLDILAALVLAETAFMGPYTLARKAVAEVAVAFAAQNKTFT